MASKKKSVIIVLICALVVACICGYGAGKYALHHQIKLDSYGNPIGGSFRLMDSTTGTMTDALFAKKWLVVGFGAIHCTQAQCRSSLLNMGEALNKVDPHSHHMSILFVSLDPQRDDPGHMRQFINSFPTSVSSRIVMGTASEHALDDLLREYHAQLQRTSSTEWQYETRMSPRYVVMAPHMRYMGLIPSDEAPQAMKKQLMEMVFAYKAHEPAL